MSIPVLTLTPYSWRGRQYRDLRNLMRAVDKAHPHSAISFTVNTMHVRDLRTNAMTEYAVERGSENAIAAEPRT